MLRYAEAGASRMEELEKANQELEVELAKCKSEEAALTEELQQCRQKLRERSTIVDSGVNDSDLCVQLRRQRLWRLSSREQ